MEEGVTDFGRDLASGHVLLKLIQAVASNAIEVEEIREEVPKGKRLLCCVLRWSIASTSWKRH